MGPNVDSELSAQLRMQKIVDSWTVINAQEYL